MSGNLGSTSALKPQLIIDDEHRGAEREHRFAEHRFEIRVVDEGTTKVVKGTKYRKSRWDEEWDGGGQRSACQLVDMAAMTRMF